MDTSRQWAYINGLNGGGCLDYGRCHSLGLVARFICVPFDPSWMNEWVCVCLWKFSELQKVDRPKAQCVLSKNVCLYKRASERIARVTKKGNEMKQDKMGKLFGTGPIVVVWASLVFSHFSLDRRLECNSWNDRRNNGTHWICCAMGDTPTHTQTWTMCHLACFPSTQWCSIMNGQSGMGTNLGVQMNWTMPSR